MIKHLHFVQSLEPLQGAGLGSAALGLHLALARLTNAESNLIATRHNSFEFNWPGVKQFHRLPPAKAFFAPRLLYERRRLVDSADLLHGHGFYTAVNASIGKAARKAGKPLAYHVHGFLEPYILSRSKRKKKLAHVFFENGNFAYAKLWRAINSTEVDQIRAAGISAPIEVIPNGIDLELLDKESSEINVDKKEQKRLLFLSRIHPKKGLDLLIPAWATISKDFPEWELRIVGPDESGYADKVQRIIREIDAKRCSIHPGVFGRDKTYEFLAADAFVLPSYSEGFPMVLLEAAAFRLPTLQTTACNFPQLTEHGGAFCAEATLESISAELKKLLSCDERELEQRGDLARQLVARDYDWKVLAKQLDDACRVHCF